MKKYKIIPQSTHLHRLGLFLILSISLLAVSCKSAVAYSYSRYQPIDKNVKLTLTNTSHYAYNKRNEARHHNLLHLLNAYDIATDSVSIAFSEKDELIVTYIDTTQALKTKQELIFNGRFKDKHTYELFFAKQRAEFPPLIPIIYSKTHIDRIRIKVFQNGDLWVENLFERTGNIFILGGGVTYRTKYHFRNTKH